MIKSSLAFGLLFILWLILQSGIYPVKDYSFSCSELKANGVIVLVTEAQKNNTKVMKAAVKKILYEGFSSKACGNQAAILNSEIQKNEFSLIEKAFFSRHGDYKKFSSNRPEGGVLYAEVNASALKIYLIEKKIIKSLSNGF